MTLSDDAIAVTGFAELTLSCVAPEELASFYGEVFGLPRIEEGDDRIWLGVGPAARLGLWLPGVKEFGDRGGAHVHFALSVPRDALAVIAERARARGAAVDGPVDHDGGDQSLYVTDPEGNRVEAWTRYESVR
jgi:catechol-2,3-dioxygenase